MKTNREELKQFINARSKDSKVRLVSHYNPDEDALGSLLLMKYILEDILEIDNEVLMYIDDQVDTDSYNMFEGIDEIIHGNVLNDLGNDDVLILLDIKSGKRIVKGSIDNFEIGHKYTVCIDHHNFETIEDFDIYFSTPQFNFYSNVELIFKIYLDDIFDELDSKFYEAGYLGLLGDTGLFKFVTAKYASSFDFASRLIKKVNKNPIEFELQYRRLSNSQLKALGILLKNITEVNKCKHPFLYSYICGEDEGLSYLDFKAAYNYFKTEFLAKTKGYQWGVCIYKYKADESLNMSFRSSTDSVNVKDLAMAFGGGGHPVASRAELDTNDFELAINDLVRHLDNNEILMN